MSWPWSELGFSGPAELPEIRRAYAQRLKTTHPEEDPEGFQRLHDAYQEASRIARRRKRTTTPQADPAEPAPTPFAPEEAPPEGEGEPPPNPEESSGDGPDAGKPAEDWDYNRLFAEGKEESRQDEGHAGTQTADWDYDRLFAEGEEESREARCRKIQELREKNKRRYAAQEAEQRRKSSDEEEAWSAVMAAVHALELLRSIQAPLPEWQRFLKSPVFWNARANLDFIFALEDFLEQNPDLPKVVRQAIFTAYGFARGPARPEYRRLYQLLNVSSREKRRIRREGSPWRSYPLRRKIATVFGVAFLVLLGVLAFWDLLSGARAAVGSLFRSKPGWEETALEWLEEDFGRAFVHPMEDQPYIFAPASDPRMYFFAYRGDAPERDLEQGQPGYETNYADRMVMAAFQRFAQEQEALTLGFDSAGDGFQDRLGETPGAYLLHFPLAGAGESITQLGRLLEELRQEDWYSDSLDYEVFLCYGDLSFYKARSTEEDFDSDYARSLYENKLGPEMCRYIADQSGIADRDLGTDTYVLLEQGSVTLNGQPFFWTAGLKKPPDNTVLAHYFLSEDGTELFVLPPETLDAGVDLEALRQMPHTVQLLQELGEHGAVTVWDLMHTE